MTITPNEQDADKPDLHHPPRLTNAKRYALGEAVPLCAGAAPRPGSSSTTARTGCTSPATAPRPAPRRSTTPATRLRSPGACPARIPQRHSRKASPGAPPTRPGPGGARGTAWLRWSRRPTAARERARARSAHCPAARTPWTKSPSLSAVCGAKANSARMVPSGLASRTSFDPGGDGSAVEGALGVGDRPDRVILLCCGRRSGSLPRWDWAHVGWPATDPTRVP
jgi:hypothetical protein